MIYHSTHTDDKLWYLIFRGQQKEKEKLKHTKIQKQQYCSYKGKPLNDPIAFQFL